MFNYFGDGANHQAQSVLMYLNVYDGIEGSWDNEKKAYVARPEVARWKNCREQGYIVYMRSKDYLRQINIAFFEHRNSDQICAVKWEQVSCNSISIETAIFGEVYKNKCDTSYDVDYGNVAEMADWIYQQLEHFWKETTEV